MFGKHWAMYSDKHAEFMWKVGGRWLSIWQHLKLYAPHHTTSLHIPHGACSR